MSHITESNPKKITAPHIRARKGGPPIVALTAYDYPTARLVDEAGFDFILVGDSLAQTVLGYDSTLPVTLEEMLHATRAVRRGVRRALIVGDMPFGTYQDNAAHAVKAAIRDGTLAASRLENYRKIQKELEFLESRTDTRLQQNRKDRDKRIHKAFNRLKPKRG